MTSPAPTDLIVTGSYSVRHHMVFTAPDDSPIVILLRGDTKAAFKQVNVEVIADADGNAEVLKTRVTGSGYAVRDDGTLTGSKRNLSVGNLHRLPTFLRDAIVAEVEKRGVRGLVEDLDRLAGMGLGYAKHHEVSQEIVRG